MKQRVEQTPNSLKVPIHKSQKLTIINGLKKFWRRGKCLNLPAVAIHIRFFTRGEKQLGSSLQEGNKGCSQVIIKVIEATAGSTGLCVVWLTEMKRIVSHTVIT
jgi:hypothetical protein